jgi:hypothetical protein
MTALVAILLCGLLLSARLGIRASRATGTYLVKVRKPVGYR